MGTYSNVISFKGDLHDIDAKLLKLKSSFGSAYSSLGEKAEELNPALQHNIKKLDEVGVKTLELKGKLQSLKDSRGGILKGTIESDIESLKKAQQSLKAYQEEYKNAKNPTAKVEIGANIDIAKSKLLEEYNKQVSALKREYDLAGQSAKIYTAEILNLQRKELSLLNSSRELEQSTNKLATTQIKTKNSFSDSLVVIGKLTASYYSLKGIYDITLGRGFEFNKLVQKETVGLKLLIAQNLKSVDVKGKAVSALEKFKYAQLEANKAIEIARRINVDTPHSLGETLQIYKLLIPQVLKYGGNLEDAGVITKRVSVLSNAMGIEFQQLLTTVDSLMSGAMNESGLKRAMEQFGLTQEAVNQTIKDGGDVVELFKKKLKQVEPAAKEVGEIWKGTTNKFLNEWDTLWGELQKPIFSKMTEEVREATAWLRENKEEIKDTAKAIGMVTPYVLGAVGAWASWRLGVIALNSAMKSTPWGWVATALGVIGTLVTKQIAIEKKYVDMIGIKSDAIKEMTELQLKSNKKILQQKLSMLLLEKKKLRFDVAHDGFFETNMNREQDKADLSAITAEIKEVRRLNSAMSTEIKIKKSSKAKSDAILASVKQIGIEYKKAITNEKLLKEIESYNKSQISEKVKLEQKRLKVNKEITKIKGKLGENISDTRRASLEKQLKEYTTARFNINKELSTLKGKTAKTALKNYKAQQVEVKKAVDLEQIKLEIQEKQNLLSGKPINKIDKINSEISTLKQKISIEVDEEKNLTLKSKLLDKEIEKQKELKNQKLKELEISKLNLTINEKAKLLAGKSVSNIDKLKSELLIIQQKLAIEIDEKSQLQLTNDYLDKQLAIQKELKKIEEKKIKKFVKQEKVIYKKRIDDFKKLHKEELKFYEDRKKLSDAYSKNIKSSIDVLSSDILNGKDIGKSIVNSINTLNKANLSTFQDMFSSVIEDGVKYGFKHVDWSLINKNGELTKFGISSAGLFAGIGKQYAVGNTADDQVGEKIGKDIGSTAGTIIGSYWGPLGSAVGDAVGTALGGALGRGFGGTKSQYVQFDGSMGYIEQRTSGGQWRHDKYKVMEEETKEFLYDFEKTKELYLDLYDTLGLYGEELNIEAKKYNSQEFFNEVIPKEFLSDLLDIPKTIEAEVTKNITDYNTMTTEAITATIKIENPKLTKVYDAWKFYAERIDKNVTQAIVDELNKIAVVKEGIYQTLNRDDKQALFEHQIDNLAKNRDKLEEELSVTGVTLEHFGDMYDEAIHNGDLLPEQITAWENLGNNLIATENASYDFANALASVRDSYASATTSLSDYLTTRGKEGEELAKIQVQLAESEYKTKLAVLGLDTDTKIEDLQNALNESISTKASGISGAIGKEGYISDKDAKNVYLSEHIDDINSAIDSALALGQAEDSLKSAREKATETTSNYSRATTDYSSNVQGSVEELIYQSDNLNNFFDWHHTFKLDDLEVASYNLSKYQEFHQQSLEKLGVASMTATEWEEQYAEALKSGLTKEQVSTWEELGDSIKGVWEAQQKYNDSLEEQRDKLKDFEDWNSSFGLDGLDLAIYNLDKASSNLSNALDADGFTLNTITPEQYIEHLNNAIEAGFPKASIDDWENLGKSLKTATEAQKAYQEAMVAEKEYIETFSTYYRTVGKDGIDLLEIEKQIADERVKSALALDGFTLETITIDEYVEHFNNALEAGFPVTTIDNWHELGDAVMEADKATRDYKKAIEEEMKARREAHIGDMSNVSSTLFNYQDELEKLLTRQLEIELENQQAITDAQEKAGKAHLDYLDKVTKKTEEMYSKASDSLEELIFKLKGGQEDTSTSLYQNLVAYNKEVADIKEVISQPTVNEDIFNEATRNLISYTNSLYDNELYNDSMNVNIIDTLESLKYTFEHPEKIAKVKIIEDTSSATANLHSLTEDEIARMAELRDLTKYFSGLMATDKTLSTLDNTLVDKFATTHSLTAGQYAELLKISEDGILTREEIKNLKELSINDIEALIALNKNNYSGFTDVVKAIENIELEKEVARTTYLTPTTGGIDHSIANTTVTYNIATGTETSNNSSSSSTSYSEAQADATKFANMYAPVGTDITTSDAYKYIMKGYGYANGGYTGNIPIDEIAGYVHGQELVLDARETKSLGLNYNGASIMDLIKKPLKIDVSTSKKSSNKILERIYKKLEDIEKRNSNVVELNKQLIQENRKLQIIIEETA